MRLSLLPAGCTPKSPLSSQPHLMNILQTVFSAQVFFSQGTWIPPSPHLTAGRKGSMNSIPKLQAKETSSSRAPGSLAPLKSETLNTRGSLACG